MLPLFLWGNFLSVRDGFPAFLFGFLLSDFGGVGEASVLGGVERVGREEDVADIDDTKQRSYIRGLVLETGGMDGGWTHSMHMLMAKELFACMQ